MATKSMQLCTHQNANTRCHLVALITDTAMRKPKPTPDYLVKFCGDCFYHIYNRTNGGELLFRTDEDRRFFLKQYDLYLSPFLKTFAYQLLGNHFHFVVQIKSEEAITSFLESIPLKERTIPQKAYLAMTTEKRVLHRVLENQFLRLFTSYATVYNSRHKRKGNLFNRPFKRVAVNSEEHFGHLIYYIHTNCKKHKLQDDFISYTWSSYHAMVSDRPTKLERQFVLDWFGGLDAFIAFHERENDTEEVQHWFIEG